MSKPHNSCIWHGLGSQNTVHVFPGVIFHIKKQEHSQVQTSKALNAMHSVHWELQRMEASKKTSAAAADCSKYMKGQYHEDSPYFLFLNRGSSNWSKFHLHWSDGLDHKTLIFFKLTVWIDFEGWFLKHCPGSIREGGALASREIRHGYPWRAVEEGAVSTVTAGRD